MRKRAADREARKKVETLLYQLKIAEGEAELARASARRQILTICKDLVPVAAGLARKGRPRLMAVIAKILADPHLRVNWQTTPQVPKSL